MKENRCEEEELVIELEVKLKMERQVLISYLKTKIQSEDWHAVSDAAMDLREVESALRTIKALTFS